MGEQAHDSAFSAYGAVARTRRKELKVRLALAVFLAGAATALAPSVWPAAWLAAVFVGQAMDVRIFRPLYRNPSAEPSATQRRLCMASAAANTAIYLALAGYVWVRGGEAGHVFAMVQVAGSLLHVTLGLYHVRGLLIAAAVPHAAWFLGLPFATATLTRMDWVGATMVFVASLLYLSHLIVAFRLAETRTGELKAANALAIEERRRAESANAAKSDFLATVSHEIRTPLNAVIAAAHLLKRSRLDPTQDAHVAMLLDGGEALLGIVNDVLDVSKIEAGKMTLEEAEFELPAKVASLVRLWEPRAADKGLILRTEGVDRLPPRVRADALRLQQILFNLISNAVKFTEAGEVALTAGRDGDRVWFEVADTGCGIAPEALERVFASFEQVDSEATRRFGGTGLGLAISRRLAELMGGTLTARSEPGFGSVFRLEVPVQEVATRPDARAESRPDAAPAGSTGLSVLVAEDHEVNRRIVSLLLEPLGWSLTMAVDGGEAVRLAGERAFDVILMDMQMPVLDGPDATRAIREGGGPNAETPVVALTANAMEHHRRQWSEVGVAGFVSKPIDPAALTAAVLNAVAGRESVGAVAA